MSSSKSASNLLQIPFVGNCSLYMKKKGESNEQGDGKKKNYSDGNGIEVTPEEEEPLNIPQKICKVVQYGFFF